MDTSLWAGAVRSEGRPSCSPVLQALILLSVTPENFGFPGFSFAKVDISNLLAYFFALNPPLYLVFCLVKTHKFEVKIGVKAAFAVNFEVKNCCKERGLFNRNAPFLIMETSCRRSAEFFQLFI